MKPNSYGLVPYRFINNKVYIYVNKTSRFSDWNFFKGKIEEGETIEDCAQREFYEESGVKIKKKYFEDYFYQTTKRKGIGIFLVDYELLKVFDIKLDKKEIYSASWENLEKIIFSKNQRKIQSDLILHFNKQYIKLICKMNGTLKY